MNLTESTKLQIVKSINDNASTFNNGSTYSDNESLPEIILNSYVGPTLCVFGVCGNILNLIILFKGKLNESPYLYLKTLAMTDMLALILSFIHMSFSGKSPYYSWQVFNAYVFFPMVNFFMAASVWLTVGVTIDRFIYVKAPLLARSYCSINRARIRIASILMLTGLISFPRFFCYRVQEKDGVFTMQSTGFRSMKTYYKIYDFACIALFHAAPLIILMLCNVYLICAVHKARSTRKELDIRNNKEKDWQKDQRRFTITLISIVILSIIAILPSTIGDLALMIHISVEDYRRLRLSGNVLLLCNLSMNFLLYCAFNTRFVRVMKSLFCEKPAFIYNRYDNTAIPRSRSPNFSVMDTTAEYL